MTDQEEMNETDIADLDEVEVVDESVNKRLVKI